MTGNTYALIRVSTKKQKEARQVKRMTKLGIPKQNIIIEKESGKSTERLKYHKLVKKLKVGDTLYIENIDRLSRDYDGIISEWQKLTIEKGVILKVLDTPMLDTDQKDNSLLMRFIRNIMLHILAFQAESEWEKIKSRQADGIALAIASGKRFGRPKVERTEEEIEVVRNYIEKTITLDTALSLLNLKKSAFYSLCSMVSDSQD